MFAHVLVAAITVHYVNSQCSYSNWGISMDTKGQSRCSELDRWMNGLERWEFRWDDPLAHLEGAYCCSPPAPWTNADQIIVYDDWSRTLDSDYSWAFCRVGYFLQGLYRSDTGWPRYQGYLFNLEAARCIKPVKHPLTYGRCTDVDITSCMTQQGKCSCPGGYFMTGIYRADGDDLYFLKKIRCCTTVDTPIVLDEKSKIQSFIMDNTLWYMAYLGHYLGYGWAYGCRGVQVGEDFVRQGDVWAAETQSLWGQDCTGDKWNVRLNLAYSDWGFEVKDIVYGQSVIENLQAETIDTGVLYNRASSPVTESLQRTKTIQSTVTHSTTSSFTNSHELGISLDFQIKGVGVNINYKTTFTSSTSTTDEKSLSQTDGFSKQSSITLGPMEAAKYTIIMSKSRTTVPYTAIIGTKFSTEFRGFMRWEDGSGNFHQNYRYDKDRQNVWYRFGDSSTPFYKALKKQSTNNEAPWMWNMMLQQYPITRAVIDRLTEETQYQFTLSGKLEKVEGTSVHVVWEKIPLSRRDLSDDEAPSGNATTYIATSGPDDKPAVVEYPKVELNNMNMEPIEAIEIPSSIKKA